jgi:hypothetical protein
MANKLKNLVITKVALVDEGSCSAAHIKLFKRKEEGGKVMEFTEIVKGLPEDQQAVINAEIEKAKKQLPEGAMSAEDKKKMEDNLAKAEKDKTLAMDEVNNLKKQKDADGQSEEELMKSLDPAVRAVLEKAKNQAAAAEAAVKKMKEDADNAEALAKAKELPNLGAKEEDLAKSLKSLKATDETLFNDIYGIMKAANNMIADGGVLGETGVTGSGADNSVSKGKAGDVSKASNDAWSKIEKAAEAIQKSAGCNKAQAIKKAISENRELYTTYVNSLE